MTRVITAIYELLGLYLIIIDIKFYLFLCLGEEKRSGDHSPENRVKEIMEKLDRNDDKNISRQEFIEGCLKDHVLRNLLAPNI